MCLQSHLFFTSLEHFSFSFLLAVLCWAHTAVCSSPRASLTLFLLLAAEAILTVSLLRGFFKLDLKGLFILAENNTKVKKN